MLVILTEEQIISAQKVCQGCLLADRKGLPRLKAGRLTCANSLERQNTKVAKTYQCQMGFTIADLPSCQR
ncbi:MAG: hypothetical protein D6756_05980 [Cyanobacteria bacterium J083]|nr:MAG: hypothetical protein D6756_05980 [Cyanobacteria bacterium J083]